MSKRTVYRHTASPYRQLLQLAGCEEGDLQQLVSQDGVEGALQRLFHHGVYLTADEFKGRRPVERGSVRLTIDPVQLRNPAARAHVVRHTGGSGRGSAIVAFNLAFTRDGGPHWLLSLDAVNGTGWQHSVWAVPGGLSRESASPVLCHRPEARPLVLAD